MNDAWRSAVRSGAVDELQRLAAGGADVDARDGHGQTALMLAAHAGCLPVVQWLIGQGAALDHTAKYGLSALMLAAVNGHREVVRALLEAGADAALRGTGAPGFAGRTALDLAAERGDGELARILGAPAPRR